ncbi:MAG: hypothetical protein A2X35_10605 [Elusimicrobia bacterium GWA2_61_42]|nr:MAG: hypothetical protein A2X35_10605 [Elusimicrobia bacterium GWA2_61_42]OGR74711.1 MAG: hypothetical protein A2X38_02570 [Elusimicrobia bacterium GWC2_61_25]
MPIKVWTRIAVIRLSRIALFRFFFTFYYRAAWLVFRRLASFLFPDIVSIKVHRGYASGDWEPGISDIDVVMEIGELPPDQAAGFLLEWNRFYRAFRLFFPVMGEPIIVTEREQEIYYAWGDIRAFPALPPEGPPSALAEARTNLALWTECLHAHTRLCKIAVAKTPVPGPLAVRELRKSVLDIARHSLSAPARPPFQGVKSRRETEARLKDFKDFPAAELSELLGRGKAAWTDDREVKRLAQLACAHATNILERDAMRFFHLFEGLTGPSPATTRFAAPPREDEAAANMLVLFKKRFGDFFDSAVLDNIFSSVVVFKYIPGAASDLACGISILDCMAEWNSAMHGPVFLLGPRSRQLMGLGAFEDDPLKMGFPEALELNAESAVCLQSGAREPFSAHRRTIFGAGESARLAPRPELLEALYRESLGHFLRTWRGLLPAGAGGPVYAVSRAVSLWLYFVKGIARPCFPLQPLIKTFKRERGQADAHGLFETSLLKGLQPGDAEFISAINAETLRAAAAGAAEQAFLY